MRHLVSCVVLSIGIVRRLGNHKVIRFLVFCLNHFRDLIIIGVVVVKVVLLCWDKVLFDVDGLVDRLNQLALVLRIARTTALGVIRLAILVLGFA